MNPSNGNPGKPGEAIFAKYFNGLRETSVRLGGIDEAAVRLALHLAITDAYGAGTQVGGHDLLNTLAGAQAGQQQDCRAAESAIAQIGRLNEWLETNAPALYHDPNLSTAEAVLAELGDCDRRMIEQSAAIADLRASLMDANRDAARARQELTTLIAERDGLRQQRASLEEDLEATQQAREENRQEVQQLRQELTQALQRAAAVDPTPAPDWGPSHPAWQGLTAVDLDVINQLASGATKFRKLARPARCDLVLRAIRHLASERNGTISGGDWDRYRPLWMPTTGAVMMLSDDGRWPSLLALALETPAASAA